MAGELGGHAAGFGPAAGGGVDQDGFLDGGELAEQFPDRQVQPGLAGAVAHQVGELQGQHAGEYVHPDVVVERAANAPALQGKRDLRP